MKKNKIHQYGLSMIEMTLVIIISSMMFIEGYKNIQSRVGDAEKAMVDSTIAAIKSGLVIQYSSYIVAHQKEKIKQLVLQNPFDLLQTKPSNYIGEINHDHQLKQKQAWAYNVETKELLYRIKNKKSFKTHENLLHFRLLLQQAGGGMPTISLWTLKEKIDNTSP